MTPVTTGTRTADPVTAEELVRRSGALEAALRTGGGELDPAAVAAAQEILAKVAARTSMSGGRTVVALAGATGSGKSSLFNALVGESVATIGARRPTTSTPTAALWGPEPAGRLLDWLDVPTRYAVDEASRAALDGDSAQPAAPLADRVADGDADRPTDATATHGIPVPAPSAAGESAGDGPARDTAAGGAAAEGSAGTGSLDGLVLLDLPDFDSREASHRLEAERVLDLADVFVWVTDPQKYADAVLHDDYVRRLADHEAVMIAVLNQADRLTPDAVAACRADLGRLLAADGVRGVEVLVTSVRTGSGITQLRARLADAVAQRTAARHRLAADVTAAVRALRREVSDSEPTVPASPDSPLVDALSRAAGVPVVLAAVQADYRRQSAVRAGWLFSRWTRRLTADPLARLRLGRARPTGSVDVADVRAVLGRSSIPAPSPSARAAVSLATRRLADDAARGLPVRWADAVHEAARPDDDALAGALDQAILRTPLRARDPLWWRVLGGVQWVAGLDVLSAVAWLTVLAILGWLQLPQPETPRLGALPVPFLLLSGGIVLGLLVAALARLLGRIGARRRRRLIGRRLSDAIAAVAQTGLVTPVREVLERHRTTREQLDAAASR